MQAVMACFFMYIYYSNPYEKENFITGFTRRING
jgi:hypothetical protein